MFGFRRITRYVWSELVVMSLWGVLFWTFLFLMNALFFVAEKAITLGLGWDLTFRLLAYEIPELLVATIPIGVLFGTMMAVGRLSSDQEWVALQSVGVGIMGFLRPVVLNGLAAFLVTWVIYAFVFPESNFAARSLQPELMFSRNMAANIKPRVFYTDLPGVALFVSNVRPGRSTERGRLEGVLLHRDAKKPHARSTDPETPESKFEELFLARAGDLRPVNDEGVLQLDLIEGVRYAYLPESPGNFQLTGYGELNPRLQPPAYFRAFRQPPQQGRLDLNVPELFADLERVAGMSDPNLRRLTARGLHTELHKRFALPFAALLFSILAVPLGVTRARTGKGAAFLLSLIVLLLYWLLFTTAQDQAANGKIPPWAGIWAANAAILLWIVYAYWRLRRSGGQSGGLFFWLLVPASNAVKGLVVARKEQRPAENDDAQPPHRTPAATRLISLMDRNVLTGFLRILFLALLSTYVVYAIVELKDLLDGMVKNDQPLSLLGTFFFYFTPGMINLVLPISCLVAAVLAFTIMAKNGELTAFMSSGLSLRRSTVPVLLVTAALCVVYFFIEDRVAPQTNRMAQEVKDQILGRQPRSYGASASGRWTIGNQGRLYQYRAYDSAEEVFEGLHVFNVNRDELRVEEHLYTETAKWNGTAWTLGPGWWRAYSYSAATRQGMIRDSGVFEERVVTTLDPPENFERQERSLAGRDDIADQMSLSEIDEQIASLEDSGYDATKLWVAYHAKWAQPMTPLVMVILGLPFAFRIGRRGSLYGVGVALLLVIVYWATFAVFRALGFETILPPLLAVWAPNILYTLLGLYLILHIRT